MISRRCLSRRSRSSVTFLMIVTWCRGLIKSLLRPKHQSVTQFRRLTSDSCIEALLGHSSPSEKGENEVVVGDCCACSACDLPNLAANRESLGKDECLDRFAPALRVACCLALPRGRCSLSCSIQVCVVDIVRSLVYRRSSTRHFEAMRCRNTRGARPSLVSYR